MTTMLGFTSGSAIDSPYDAPDEAMDARTMNGAAMTPAVKLKNDLRLVIFDCCISVVIFNAQSELEARLPVRRRSRRSAQALSVSLPL